MDLGGSQRGGMHGAQRGGPALSLLWGHHQRVSPARLLSGSRQDLPHTRNWLPSPLLILIQPQAEDVARWGGDTTLSPRLSSLSPRASAWPCVLPSHPCPCGAAAQGHSIIPSWGLSAARRILAPGWLWICPSSGRAVGAALRRFQLRPVPIPAHEPKDFGSTRAEAPTAPRCTPPGSPRWCHQSPATRAQPILGAPRLLLRR